jgi:hypothetical protein
MVKIVYSTVSGTVTDSVTPTTLIAGAIVSLRSGTAVVKTDTAGADGKFQFDSVAVGSYTVRASAAGYVTKSVTANVTSATAVAADVPMVKIQYGSLSGTVTDSVIGTAIKGAIISVRSGFTTIKVDTTGSDGKYSFDSIPTGVYTIRASDSSFVSLNVPDTVKAEKADTINFIFSQRTANIVAVKNPALLGTSFSVSSKGVLTFGNGAESGEIAVFGLDGKQLFGRTVSRHTVSLTLPENTFSRGKAIVVKYNGTNFAYLKKVLLP